MRKLGRNRFRSFLKTHLHSGRKLGTTGYIFNRPACVLCNVYDARFGHRIISGDFATGHLTGPPMYCGYCFPHVGGLSGIYGARRRRALGAIARRTRKQYKQEPLTSEVWPDNCQICHGESGGIRGNENVIDGITVCDYCTAAAWKASQ